MRAIGNADDFKGLKIRSPGGAIAADFFATLGAEAGMVPFSGMYAALKARQFDGQSDPHQVVLALKLHEVQTHLSLTGHWWSGKNVLVSRKSIERVNWAEAEMVVNLTKAALLEEPEYEHTTPGPGDHDPRLFRH